MRAVDPRNAIRDRASDQSRRSSSRISASSPYSIAGEMMVAARCPHRQWRHAVAFGTVNAFAGGYRSVAEIACALAMSRRVAIEARPMRLPARRAMTIGKLHCERGALPSGPYSACLIEKVV